MKLNQSAWLIAAAALAILGLIGIQVRWMRYSRDLLEEQFDNRVRMALCSSVEKVAADASSSEELRACCSSVSVTADSQDNIEALRRSPEMQSALTAALHFYQIDLPYEVRIQPRTEQNCSQTTPFSCSLDPILENDTHFLKLDFPGKSDYFQQRMGLMIGSSVAILLFVCLIFALATFYLLRQNRMSNRNRDFFNQMTHEFRTPLTNIRLAANLLTRKEPQLAENAYVGIIRREGDHLMHQVENVLHLASLEKGDYRLRPEPVDVHALAGDVIAGMELQIRARSAEVRLVGDKTDTTVQGDVFHLGNALRNVLDNALKYGGEAPRVTVEVLAETDGCRMRVSDSGRGLSEKECTRIFDKFHRGLAADGSSEKGFGLGLAYVKKIVEMHRGQVTAYSAPGCGTCVEAFLPKR